MPLSVYMDVHVPLAITDGLRRRNNDVLTSQEDGTSEMDDEPLLARATELGRLLFTQWAQLVSLHFFEHSIDRLLGAGRRH